MPSFARHSVLVRFGHPSQRVSPTEREPRRRKRKLRVYPCKWRTPLPRQVLIQRFVAPGIVSTVPRRRCVQGSVAKLVRTLRLAFQDESAESFALPPPRPGPSSRRASPRPGKRGPRGTTQNGNTKVQRHTGLLHCLCHENFNFLLCAFSYDSHVFSIHIAHSAGSRSLSLSASSSQPLEEFAIPSYI